MVTVWSRKSCIILNIDRCWRYTTGGDNRRWKEGPAEAKVWSVNLTCNCFRLCLMPEGQCCMSRGQRNAVGCIGQGRRVGFTDDLLIVTQVMISIHLSASKVVWNLLVSEPSLKTSYPGCLYVSYYVLFAYNVCIEYNANSLCHSVLFREPWQEVCTFESYWFKYFLSEVSWVHRCQSHRYWWSIVYLKYLVPRIISTRVVIDWHSDVSGKYLNKTFDMKLPI